MKETDARRQTTNRMGLNNAKPDRNDPPPSYTQRAPTTIVLLELAWPADVLYGSIRLEYGMMKDGDMMMIDDDAINRSAILDDWSTTRHGRSSSARIAMGRPLVA